MSTKITKIALTIILLTLVSVADSFGNDVMPSRMASSIIQLRQGIFDFGEKLTVADLLLNKSFLESVDDEGMISTARYGNSVLSGSTYALDIDVVNGNRTQMTLTFILVWNGGATLLKSVRLRNFNTGEDLESAEPNDKIAVLQIFSKLLDHPIE